MQSHTYRQKKRMANIPSLNNIIYFVVGISIFGFKKYWHTVFNFKDLNMSSTFKHLLQYKTVNSEKKYIHYQQYNVKISRASHKQLMTKHKIYENILARQSWVDYSPVMRFKTSLVNTEESKALTKRNQPVKSIQRQKIWCRCGSIKHLSITTRDFPVRISYRKTKKMALGMGPSQSET